jgi:sugar phosphate isomerase/epimerase
MVLNAGMIRNGEEAFMKPLSRNSRTGVGLSKLSMFPDEVYEPKAGFEPALALLERMGIGHIDIRRVNGVDSVIDASADDLDAAVRLLRKHAITVAMLATPIFKCPIHGNEGPAWGGHHGIGARIDYQRYMDLLPRTFTLAEKFGTRKIRCFAFWRQHRLDDVFDEVVEKLARAAELAKAAGFQLLLENEHNTLAGTGVEQARILKAINNRSILGIYDEGNSRRINGDIKADYEAMRGWIGHIHVKHRRLDVICGWPTVIQPYHDLVSGYRTFFLWKQPKGPFRGEIRVGGKKFQISAARTTLSLDNSDVEYFRPLFQNLKNDGYEGLIAVDNGWEGFEDRLPVPELEAHITTAMADLARLLDEIWTGKSGT